MPTIKKSISLLIKILFIFGGAMITAYSTVSTFLDLPPIIHDWRYGFVLGLLLFMGGVGWIVFDLYRRYVWWSQPKAKLIPNTEHELKDFMITKHAYLYVFNEEDLPITDCYATIESGKLVDGMRHIEFIEEDRLKWAAIYATEGCKIEIPPKKQLRIDVADTLEQDRIRFSTCNSTQSSPTGIYSHIRIRVDGNFNGKAIKPHLFDGYLYAEGKKWGPNVVEIITKVVDGKRIEDSKQAIQLPYVDMVFERGDWIKDKRIPRPKELEHKKEKTTVFTKKASLKTLKKVIRRRTKSHVGEAR